jgi:hypothetical protein
MEDMQCWVQQMYFEKEQLHADWKQSERGGFIAKREGPLAALLAMDRFYLFFVIKFIELRN